MPELLSPERLFSIQRAEPI